MNPPTPLIVGLGGAGINIVGEGSLPYPTLNLNTSRSRDRDEPVTVIGHSALRGRGANRSPQLGRSAIDESFEIIYDVSRAHSAVIIVSGVAGGTGGAAPYLAERLLSRELVVGLFAIQPFKFEPPLCEQLKQSIDAIRPRLVAYKEINEERIWNTQHFAHLAEFFEEYNASIRQEIREEVTKLQKAW